MARALTWHAICPTEYTVIRTDGGIYGKRIGAFLSRPADIANASGPHHSLD